MNIVQERPAQREEKVEQKHPIIIPKRRNGSLMDFFMMKTNEVMGKFMSLPGAEKVGKGDRSFVYVPATREKSVLLVAHCDTVWKDKEVKVGYCNGIYGSTEEGVGIGADDRAGITMLWKLRKLGHALLIPNAEENGCIGSRFLMEHPEWRKKLNQHLFAIEMDRMNDSDLAFYNVATSSFKDWCEKQFPGYKRVHGSYTDICVLCDEDKHKEDCLDGVNISIGYYDQHRQNERLVMSEWQKTLSLLHKVLSQKDLPSFRHKYIEYTRHTQYNNEYNNNRRIPTTTNSYDVKKYSGYNSNIASKNDVEVLDSLLVCPSCRAMFDESEYKIHGNKCFYCGEGF